MATAEFIRKLAQEKYSLKEFKKKIEEVYEKTDLSFDLVSESTMFKWYNGHQTPKDEWLIILAEVLEVEKAELVEGRDLPMLKHNLELEKKYEDSKTETDLIDAILFDDKIYLRNISKILISFGMFCLFYVLSMKIIGLIFFLFGMYFIKKDNDYSNKKVNNSKEEKKNKLIEIFKYIKNHNTVSSVLVHYMITVFTLAVIPLLEFLFYRGNCYISCTLYLIIGTVLYILSMKK